MSILGRCGDGGRSLAKGQGLVQKVKGILQGRADLLGDAHQGRVTLGGQMLSIGRRGFSFQKILWEAEKTEVRGGELFEVDTAGHREGRGLERAGSHYNPCHGLADAKPRFTDRLINGPGL